MSDSLSHPAGVIRQCAFMCFGGRLKKLGWDLTYSSWSHNSNITCTVIFTLLSHSQKRTLSTIHFLLLFLHIRYFKPFSYLLKLAVFQCFKARWCSSHVSLPSSRNLFRASCSNPIPHPVSFYNTWKLYDHVIWFCSCRAVTLAMLAIPSLNHFVMVRHSLLLID